MSHKQADFFPGQESAQVESKGTVLLVEDDAVLRMMLRNSLESSNYQVVESDSRPDALTRLHEHAEIAVAVVDLGLPPVEHTTLEGLATLRAINSEHPTVKAIVLTGQDEEKSAFDAIKEGAFDFLSKPAKTSDILMAVQRAFLFHRKEQDLMADGLARLQFNARYADGLKAVREEAEEKLVRQVLKETGFNVYKSAEKLGIKRESVYYFMKKFQITRDDANLYAYLIIIGSSILGATGWLLYQYRTQLQRTQELIHLNEQLHYDLPDFLRQCWPILERGGVHGLHWELDWFGTSLQASRGEQVGDILERIFEVQEIRLLIRLYHMKRGWERRYFSLAQAENFFLLLRMNLWIKIGSVQGAFEQTAKMTVFFKHDVKNMVQLLSLSAEQLQNTTPEQERRLLDNLRAAIPAVLDRAEHMLRALNEQGNRKHKQRGLLDEPAIALETILAQTAALYDLPVTINGKANIFTDKDRLLSIVDNLLGNYSRLARISNQRPHLLINISKENNKVITSIEDQLGNPFAWPERLFEPFWSEHGDGRGIGLYQSRQQANAAGGDLSAVLKQTSL